MTEKTGVAERLNDTAAVKGTMLLAHLAWAQEHVGDPRTALLPLLDPGAAALLGQTLLPTQWILFRHLVAIDRAIAAIAGGSAEETFLALGRHSARVNLQGAYRSSVSTQPHRFFEKGSLLHDRFQNFGRSRYERLGERSGRVTIEEYAVHSPVFCTTGTGYYLEALALMNVAGPIRVEETTCACSGGGACSWALGW